MNDARRDRRPEAPGQDDPGLHTPPPFLGSWNRLYALVALNLVVLILLFYLFRKAFE